MSRVCLVLLSSCLLLQNASSTMKFRSEVRKMDQCDGDSAKSLVDFQDFRLNRVEDNRFNLNGKIIIKQNVPGPVGMVIDLEECPSEQNIAGCMHYGKIPVNTICEEIGKEDKLWSDFISRMKIHKECPLRKGVYTVKEYPVDLDMLENFVRKRSYWKVAVNAHSQKKNHVICVNIWALLEPILPASKRKHFGGKALG